MFWPSSSSNSRATFRCVCRSRPYRLTSPVAPRPILFLFSGTPRSAFDLSRTHRTRRPKKNAPVGSKGAALKQHIDATLGSGNLREAVLLPPGEDLNEWLAVNTVDFYNAISMLYATLAEYCTDGSCPTMCAGPKYEYRWADGVKVKKPIACTAPQYVDYLLSWVESQVDDEALFPQAQGADFPSNFPDVVRKIFTRLFRVYAHIYHSHFPQICTLGAEAHLNTLFKHFIYFTSAFGLVRREELAPLGELVDGILGVVPSHVKINNNVGGGGGGGGGAGGGSAV